MSTGVQIGVDTGGTFTDVVCRLADGRVHMMKVPTTRGDPSVAILDALDRLRAIGIAPAAVSSFAHGTTAATNAVLERKGARVGLLTTEGFRDVLEIGRQLRRQLYATMLEPTTPIFLAPRRFRRELAERIGPDGAVLKPLDEEAVVAAADALVAAGVQSFAVCLLFSFLNPAHELRVREIIAERHPGVAISLSHEVDPAMREYERTVVTAFDAYLKPVVGSYLGRLEQGLRQAGIPAPLHVMQSRGGLAGTAVARERPVRLFLSGPAAGVIGGRIAGASAGADDVITIDVGGTSADIALISRRKALIRPEAVIAGYDVRVAMVDVNSIGAGGGSIARVDGAGGLRVGPDSAGSDPGPACYGRGGNSPTVTDASIVLGYLDPAYFAGGSLRLRPELSGAVIQTEVAGPLGLSVEAAALGIHRVLNAQMAEGIRLVSVRQGIDPRGFALLALGGAGALHATALARELGMTRIVVPPAPGLLSAAGLLAASIEHEVSAALPMQLDTYDPARIREEAAAMDDRAARLMYADGVEPGSVRVTYFADICYVGQAYTLEVPLDLRAEAGDGLYRSFLAAHDRTFGYAAEVPARIVNVRAIHVSGGKDELPHAAEPSGDAPVEKGRRRIVIADAPGGVAAPVLDRAALPTGYRVTGPVIIEQEDTTTLVEPGWTGEVDRVGNLVLTCA